MEYQKLGAVKSLAIAAATLAAAWQSYSFALVPSLRRTAPEMVLSQNPSDAAALSKRVLRRIKDRGQYATSPEDRKLARLSLVDTPLSRSSLRIIGFDYVAQRNRPAAAKLMAMSNKVSRRDTWAQIWLLEEAARGEDYQAILRHYHAALSVKPELAEVLNPILVSVTKFPEVRVALGPYLRSNAPWTSGFLAQASADAAISDIFEAVFPVAHHLSDEAYAPALSQIIYRLAADGRSDEAMRFAAAVWDDFDRGAFLAFAPGEATSDERLGQLAWQFSNEGGISAQQNEQGSFEVELSSLARGTAATRSIPVAGGSTYSFTQRIEVMGSSPPQQMRWQATCVAPGSPDAESFWRQALPLDAGATKFRSTIAVPPACELLVLSLIGDGPDSQNEAMVGFSELAFERL